MPNVPRGLPLRSCEVTKLPRRLAVVPAGLPGQPRRLPLQLRPVANAPPRRLGRGSALGGGRGEANGWEKPLKIEPIATMLRAVSTSTSDPKLRALEGLSIGRLRALVEQLDLRPRDKRAKESLVEALAGDFPRALGEMMREELREMCQALGLDASGKTEKELAQRILGAEGRASAPPRVTVPFSDEGGANVTKSMSRARPTPTRAARPEVLLAEVRSLILEARQQTARMVNAGLTLLYWQVGDRIRREVLGSKRAEYGAEIVSALGRQLEDEFGRGFSETNLRRIMQFAEIFPEREIVVSLIRELSWTQLA